MQDQPFSFVQLIPLLLVAIVIAIPFARICRKAGLSPWLALLSFIPPINLAFFYYLAFARWPALPAGKPTQ